MSLERLGRHGWKDLYDRLWYRAKVLWLKGHWKPSKMPEILQSRQLSMIPGQEPPPRFSIYTSKETMMAVELSGMRLKKFNFGSFNKVLI